jgi:hypothetical protein
MTAPSIRQDAYNFGSGSVTVTLGLTPNVGNRLLAIVWHDDRTALVKGGSPDPVTPTTGSGWVLADYCRTWSFYGSIEIYYRDVQVGDATTYTFTTVDTQDFSAQVFEMLDFTEPPVLRDADFMPCTTDRLSTKSTSTNSMSLLIGKCSNLFTVNTPTNYTNGGPPASYTENPYLFYAVNQNLVAVTTGTQENRVALQVEIPETGTTGPASWDRHLQYEINSVTGDFSSVTGIPTDLPDQVWDNKITFNITEADDQGNFAGGQHRVFSDSTYYTSFIVDPSVRHDGVDATTGARVDHGGSNPSWDIRVRWAASYMYIEGLAFIHDVATASSFEGMLLLEGSTSGTVGTEFFGNNVVVDKCLFHYAPALNTSIYACEGLVIHYGAENVGDTFVSISNCVFHSCKDNAGLVITDRNVGGALGNYYVDNCSFGFNGATNESFGSGILIDQDHFSSDTVLHLYNCNFGDNFDNSGGTEYADLRYQRSSLYPTLDGSHVLNGANNVFQYPPPASFAGMTNNLTGSISAANGFTQTTTQQFGIIVASTSTFGAYDLDLVQPTGSGINLALQAGTSRIGSEPDPRQDFTYDVLGRKRYSQGYDTGAFQISTASRFKYWNGTAWVDSVSVKYWNGTAWVDTVAVKYWNGSAWTDPV